MNSNPPPKNPQNDVRFCNKRFCSKGLSIQTRLVFSACWGLVAVGIWTASAARSLSQEATTNTEPRVARVQMRLNLQNEAIDVIEKGDLLTVVQEREDGFLIQTISGTKGLVAKVNAVALAESAEIYSELISKNEKDGRLYTLRAGAWWAAEKSEEALADFDKAIELGYDAAHAYMSRGLFRAANKNYEKAIEDYNKAIDKEPKDPAGLINRAAAYLSSNQLDKAEEDYSKAIVLQPRSPLFYQQRAVVRKAMGKLTEAIEDFTTAIEIYGPERPMSISAWMSRGFLYFQMGKHEEAIDDFGHVIQLNPKATVAYNNRGYNLQQLGKSVDALSDYNKAIELEPKYALAHQNRAWLLATTDNKNLRDPAGAVESATKACELTNYQDVSDMAALAAAFAANEEFDKAVGMQEKIVQSAQPAQKPFAEAILKMYLDKKPFDPNVAKELLIKTPESEKTPTQPKPPAAPPKKRAL